MEEMRFLIKRGLELLEQTQDQFEVIEGHVGRQRETLELALGVDATDDDIEEAEEVLDEWADALRTLTFVTQQAYETMVELPVTIHNRKNPSYPNDNRTPHEYVIARQRGEA